MKLPRWWNRRWVPYKVHRDLALHHRDCERAGERMYDAIEKMRRRTGAGDPVTKADITPVAHILHGPGDSHGTKVGPE